MAIDPGIAGLAARKYAIQQQQADSAQRLQQSQAGLTDVQAGLAPAEAAARNFATRGQGAAALGQANLANTTASLAPRQLSSEDVLRQGQARLYGAEAGRVGTESGLLPQQFGLDYLRQMQQHDQQNYQNQHDPLGGELNSFLQQGGWSKPGASAGAPATAPAVPGPQASAGQAPPYAYGFGQGNLIGGNPLGQNTYHAAEGMNKVPGKGDGKTDTQPAMLAPGEAVLNRGAAEHLGRDTISLLNAIGARRMGLTVGSDADVSTPNKGSNAGVDNQTGAPSGSGYAEGTPRVPSDLRSSSPQGPTMNSTTPAGPMRENFDKGWWEPADQGRTPGYAMGTSVVQDWERKRSSSIPETYMEMPSQRGDLQDAVMNQQQRDFESRRSTNVPMAGVFAPADWKAQASYGRAAVDAMPGYNYGTPYTGSAPGPGQTITSGSWDPAEAAAQAKANSAAPTPMQPAPAPGFGKRLVPPKVPAMARGSSNVSEEKGTKPMKSAPKGEAKGKPKMSPHAAAHTPDGSGLPPGIMEALMQMGQGGGGMPPGGGGIPGPGAPPPMPPSMPMPMPQVARR